MKTKRKIIVEIAVSADGYVARRDGDVAWLDRPQPKGGYGLEAFVQSIDTILWGRKTYAKGLEFGMTAASFGPKMKHYVFSRRRRSLLQGFELVTEPVKTFAQHLRRRAGKDIWMMGGAEIIGAFLDAGQIDEFSLHVIPIFIGEGIPFLKPKHRSIPLKLLSTKRYSDGVVHVHYEVLKRRGNKVRAKTKSTLG